MNPSHILPSKPIQVSFCKADPKTVPAADSASANWMLDDDEGEGGMKMDSANRATLMARLGGAPGSGIAGGGGVGVGGGGGVGGGQVAPPASAASAASAAAASAAAAAAATAAATSAAMVAGMGGIPGGDRREEGREGGGWGPGGFSHAMHAWP